MFMTNHSAACAAEITKTSIESSLSSCDGPSQPKREGDDKQKRRIEAKIESVLVVVVHDGSS